MISLEKQIELLAQFSIEFQYRLTEQDENWYNFFKEHDMAIPIATMIYLKRVEFPQDVKAKTETEMMIRLAFFHLCDALGIDRGRKHLSIQDMFRASDNPIIPEFDEETQKELERL